MSKHWKFDGEQPRIYAEPPFALGEVHPGQVVEADEAPDFRWSKSSKAEHDRQVKAAEKDEPELVLSGDVPLAQPDPTPDA